MLMLPIPAGSEPDAVPQPCSHIDWDTYTQYATWSAGPGGVDDADVEQRRADVARQGLEFAADPHLCFEAGGDMYVWAVALI